MWGTVVEHARGARSRFAYSRWGRVVCGPCLAWGRGAVAPSYVVASERGPVAVCRWHRYDDEGSVAGRVIVEHRLVDAYGVDLLSTGRLRRRLSGAELHGDRCRRGADSCSSSRWCSVCSGSSCPWLMFLLIAGVVVQSSSAWTASCCLCSGEMTVTTEVWKWRMGPTLHQEGMSGMDTEARGSASEFEPVTIPVPTDEPVPVSPTPTSEPTREPEPVGAPPRIRVACVGADPLCCVHGRVTRRLDDLAAGRINDRFVAERFGQADG